MKKLNLLLLLLILLASCSEIPDVSTITRTEYVYEDIVIYKDSTPDIVYIDTTPDIVTVYRDSTPDTVIEYIHDVEYIETEKIVKVEKIVYIEVIKEVELMGGEAVTNIDGKIYLFSGGVFKYLVDGDTLFYYDANHFVTNNVCINVETLQPVKEYEGIIKNFKKWGTNEYYQIGEDIYLNGIIIGNTRGQDLQFHENYGNSYDFFVFSDGTYETHDHRGYDYFNMYVMQWNPISNVCNPTWYENGEFHHTSNTVIQQHFEKSFRNDGIETDDYIFMLTGAVIDKKNKTLNTFFYDTMSKTWQKGGSSALFELNTQNSLFVNYGVVLGKLSNGLYVFSLGNQQWDASKVGFFTYDTVQDKTGIIKELDKAIKITGSVLIEDSVLYAYNGEIKLLNTDTREEVKVKVGSSLKGFVL